MIVFKFFIWSVAIISTLIFCKFFLFPYIKRKVILWFMINKIKKISKKSSEKEAKILNEISKGLSELKNKI